MVTAFEERDERLIHATKFIYNNNNNNKQRFTPNGINNECVSNSSKKRVQDVKYGLVCCEGCKVEGKVGLVR